MKAPFPWFGGKRRVAGVVWSRLGDCPNYVEPFFGSGAVLLNRPHEPRVETVNDLDAYVANFWRAVQADPDAVAWWADWPVSEADLHARHLWLVQQREVHRERMLTEPEYCDPQIAGWWAWGISQWIGSGWCSRPEWTGRHDVGAPRGIHTAEYRQRPSLTQTTGVHRKLPDVSGRNGTTNARGVHAKRPRLAAGGRGATCRKLPALSNGFGLGQGVTRDSGAAGRGVVAPAARECLVAWMRALQDRLRHVRICCGDWSRILGPSPTTLIGRTAVFLDPPYDPAAIAQGAGRDALSDRIYTHHEEGVSADVRAWCLERGADPLLRIALCGYEGEHNDLEAAGWAKVEWKAQGGYAVRGDGQGKRNAHRERIWFSPHCLGPHEHGPLFAENA